MSVGNGNFAAEEMISMVPFLFVTSYAIDGLVVTTESENSRRRRSVTISRCNIPKKPHAKLLPNTVEDSGSNRNAASFNANRLNASRNASKSCSFSGYKFAQTTDCGRV